MTEFSFLVDLFLSTANKSVAPFNTLTPYLKGLFTQK